MTTPVFVDFEDENGIMHTKEDQEAAYEAELQRQRNIAAKNSIVREMDKRLNAFAKAKGWNTIESLAIRAGYPGPYNEIGIYAATLMDNSLFMIDTIFEDVKMGKRSHPNSFAEIEAELPVLKWE